jgi:hypothetical protein
MEHFPPRRSRSVTPLGRNSLIYKEPQPEYIYSCFAADGISIAIPNAFQGGVRR